MRTLFGQECRFYFEDYYRGRDTKECRLIATNPASARWHPGLCQTCPVPAILAANVSPNLLLQARVGKTFLGLVQKVEVRAYCKEHRVEISDPKVGCRECAEQVATRIRPAS